jgi:hypothetical protein
MHSNGWLGIISGTGEIASTEKEHSMLTIGNEKIFIGDLHTHWYWDLENPTLIIAGMQAIGADFILLCYHKEYAEITRMDDFCRAYDVPFRVFPGRELAFQDAHIVCWIDEAFKPERYPEKNGLRANLAALKRDIKLVHYAHPAENWKGAYDGTYQPLMDLYRDGLIDAIQVQSPGPYRPFKKANIRVPVLGAFDIHACKPFAERPPYVFNKRFDVFEHIMPCSPYLTIVFAPSLAEGDILSGIKSGRTVTFNVDKEEFIGPDDLITRLKAHRFYEQWRLQRRRFDRISIQSKLVAGERSSIDVATKRKIVSLAFPGNSLYVPERAAKAKISIAKLPLHLPRDLYYSPLAVKSGDDTLLFGVRTDMPLAITSSAVTANDVPGYEIHLSNRTGKKQRAEVSLAFDNGVVRKKMLTLAAKGRTKAIFTLPEIDMPGSTYAAVLSIRSPGITLAKKKILSFPVCRYAVEKDAWAAHDRDVIQLSDDTMNQRPLWKGSDDLSGTIALRWNEKRDRTVHFGTRSNYTSSPPNFQIALR